MTCRQMNREFQHLHISAKESEWVLVINNFDIDQIKVLSDYINDREYFQHKQESQDGGRLCHLQPPFPNGHPRHLFLEEAVFALR